MMKLCNVEVMCDRCNVLVEIIQRKGPPNYICIYVCVCVCVRARARVCVYSNSLLQPLSIDRAVISSQFNKHVSSGLSSFRRFHLACLHFTVTTVLLLIPGAMIIYLLQEHDI
jgi:hypothetical protein